MMIENKKKGTGERMRDKRGREREIVCDRENEGQKEGENERLRATERTRDRAREGGAEHARARVTRRCARRRW